MKNFEAFRLGPSPENFRKFIWKIEEEDLHELKGLSFKPLKGLINIGFVPVLLASDLPEEIKRTLAGKMIKVIRKRNKWDAEKLDKFQQLESLARHD